MDDKYFYLPSQYHKSHNVCWNLVKELEEFLLDEKYFELSAQAVKLDEAFLNEINEKEGRDIFQLLLDRGRKDEHNYIVKLQLIRGIILDSCYFLQEALSCSLKRRQVVAFSLFRRQLVYNMVIMIRLFAENDFLGKFIQGKTHPSAKDNSFDPAKIDPSLKEILTQNEFFKKISGSSLFDFVFEKTKPDSLINMTNRALHPVTSFNENNATGAMNINFAFSTEQDIISQWDYIYRRIPFIIFFFVTLMDLIVFSSMRNTPEAEKLLDNRISARAHLMSDWMRLD